MWHNLCSYVPLITSPLVICGFAFIIQAILKPNRSVEWISAGSIIIFILFFFAVAQALPLGVITVNIIGLLSFSYFLFLQPEIFKNLRPLLWFLLTFYIVLLIYLLGCPIKHGDELTFWGGFSKYIHMLQQLPGDNSPFKPEHRGYMPGLALFHQLFLFSAPAFIPGFAYIAQSLILVMALLAFSKNFFSAPKLVTVLCLLLLVSLFHRNIFNDLAVDAILCCLWGSILFWLINEKEAINRAATLIPLVCLLPLVKQIGYFYAALSLLSCASITLIERRKGLITIQKTVISLSLVIFSALILWVIHLSWQKYCSAFGIISFVNDVNLQTMSQALFGMEDENKLLRYNYIKNYLFSGVSQLRFATPIWIGLLGYFLWKLKKIPAFNNFRVWIVITFWFIGFLIYSFMQFFLQTIVFAWHLKLGESPALARYLGMYILPLALALLATWMQVYEFKFKLRAPQLALFATMLLSLFLVANYKGAHYLEEKKLKSVAIANQYLPQLQKRPKVNVCEFSDGSNFPFLHPYEFIPYPIRYLTLQDYQLKNFKNCDLIVLVEGKIPNLTVQLM